MAAVADLALEEALPAGIRVLVIDDDRISLKVVCIMLKKCGYEGEFSVRNELNVFNSRFQFFSFAKIWEHY